MSMKVAILGFGFSGLMAAANMVRRAAVPITLYIVDDHTGGFGTAYGTQNPNHLLNVPANKMGAFADDVNGFYAWLQSDEAKRAQVALGLSKHHGADDFVPRVLYAAYLESIWRDTQELAAQKKLEIKLVPSRVVALTSNPLLVLTERGDAIAVDSIILAVGHEVKPLLTNLTCATMMQNPWAKNALAGAAQWASPVMLVGTGLTAVDVLLSLRSVGYLGEVVAASFSGRLPQPHAKSSAIFSFAAADIAALKTLPQMVQCVRTKIREVGDWRVVIDALRPYTQSLWQRLSTPAQIAFLTRLTTRWTTHRHRMAPEIVAQVEAEIAAKTFRMIGCKKIDAREENGAPHITIHTAQGVEELKPSRVLNCAGLELNLAKSANPLLRQMLASGMVEPHATSLGMVADKNYRAWGVLHPHLFVIGSLLTGQLLESTAVPELRQQAASITENLLQA